MKEIVDKSFASHVEKQLEDTKAREESLWTIFNAKIEHINERIESVLAKVWRLSVCLPSFLRYIDCCNNIGRRRKGQNG